MATYSTNEFRPGLKVLLEGEPCVLLEAEFVKPGKGQAFTRAKFKKSSYWVEFGNAHCEVGILWKQQM